LNGSNFTITSLPSINCTCSQPLCVSTFPFNFVMLLEKVKGHTVAKALANSIQRRTYTCQKYA
jgi:hypothetical protein